MDLKELFGDKSLTIAEFEKAIADKGIKLADISSGEYVSKEKYDAQVTVAKDWKAKHKTLSDSVDGDEGYKTKLAQLESERDDFKTKFEALENEKTTLERTSALSKLGVGEKFSKFALSEINSMVSDTVDFDTASKKWIADNSQFVTPKDEPPITLNQPTGTNKSLSDSKPSDSSNMNTLLHSVLSH